MSVMHVCTYDILAAYKMHAVSVGYFHEYFIKYIITAIVKSKLQNILKTVKRQFHRQKT